MCYIIQNILSRVIIVVLFPIVDSYIQSTMNLIQSRGIQKMKDECTLYVTVKGSKLPDAIGKMHLLQHFREFSSSIIDIELVHKKDKRYAFIKFTSGDVATAAMQSLQGAMLVGTYLLTINYGQKTVQPTHMVSPLVHHGEYIHSHQSEGGMAEEYTLREKFLCSCLLSSCYISNTAFFSHQQHCPQLL